MSLRYEPEILLTDEQREILLKIIMQDLPGPFWKLKAAVSDFELLRNLAMFHRKEPGVPMDQLEGNLRAVELFQEAADTFRIRVERSNRKSRV